MTNKQFKALERKCCCSSFGLTNGVPTGEPTNGQEVKFDPATGILYYWDGNSWEVYINGLTAPINATDIADGSVSNTEFQFLGTVTSNVQTQLNGKSNVGHGHLMADISGVDYGGWTPTITNSNGLNDAIVSNSSWLRVGEVITLFGLITLTATTATVDANCSFDLPVGLAGSGTFTAMENAAGTGVSNSGAPQEVISIEGDIVVANSVLVRWLNPSIDSVPVTFSYHLTYYTEG